MRFYMNKLRLICLVTLFGVVGLMLQIHFTMDRFVSLGSLNFPMFDNLNMSSTNLTSNVTAVFFVHGYHYNSLEAEEVRGDLKKHARTDTGQEVRGDLKKHARTDTGQEVRGDLKKHATTDTGQEVRGDLKKHARTDTGQEVRGDLKKHVTTDTDQEVTGDLKKHATTDTGQEVTGDLKKHATTDTGQEVRGDLKKHATTDTGQEVRGDLKKHATTDTGQEVRGDLKKHATTDTGQEVRGDLKKHAATDTVLEAWGKPVKPRINISVPWNRENRPPSLCPRVPQGLHGLVSIDTHAHDWIDTLRLNPELEPGGHYQPSLCKARHRVAIIVPYRDRESHLQVMLHYLHPMLIRQQLDYFVLVVEQAKPTTFNRGMLLNIGAVEAQGLWDVQCFIFHDVDLVPENDHNLYSCPENPRHMSAAVDKFGYRLPYDSILGGVAAISVKDFYKTNGYSNMYFGWGGEDDDFSRRVAKMGLKITRYRMDIARYHMISHSRDEHNEANPKRFEQLSTFETRQPTDGLNSLEYQVKKMEFRLAYTWILVTIDQQKIMENYKTVTQSS